MLSRLSLLYPILLTCGLLANPLQAESIQYQFEKSTPVGGWQIREDTQTDHKGKQFVSVIKTSLLSEETREGITCYWVEMEIDRYRVNKDKRKKDGDNMIIKSLIEKSAMQTDLANVFHNLRGFGKEMIIQNGDNDPVQFSQTGMLADMMAKSMGIQIQYQYAITGNETVSVPAGSFVAQKISGEGSTEFKMLIKKMNVKSKNISWISDSIPFSIVKMKSENEINGELDKYESVLVKYGKSGAQSKITKQAKSIQIPELPF